MNKKEKRFVILNALEPILCLIMGVGAVYTTIIAFSNVNWVSLGGKIREWYWYESIIMDVTSMLPFVIIISELYIFLKIKKKYKFYTLIFTVIEIIVSIAIYNINTFAILVSIFIFNLIKCIYRIIYKRRIRNDF